MTLSETDIFIPRPEIAHTVTQYISNNNTCNFPVHYGSKGGGKTETLIQVLKDHDGVIYIKVELNEKRSVRQLVADKVGLLDNGKPMIVSESFQLVPIFEVSRRCETGIWLFFSWAWLYFLPTPPPFVVLKPKPIVVLDVLSATSAELTSKIITESRDLACSSHNSAHVIVILSDSTSIIAKKDDFNRWRKVWVPEFTEAQAHEFLRQRGVLCSTSNSNNSNGIPDKCVDDSNCAENDVSEKCELKRLRQLLFNQTSKLPAALTQFVATYGNQADGNSVKSFILWQQDLSSASLGQWKKDDKANEILETLCRVDSLNLLVDEIEFDLDVVVAAIRKHGPLLQFDDHRILQPRTMADSVVLRKWCDNRRKKEVAV